MLVYTPFIWILFTSALINGGIAWSTRYYQDVPTVRPFRALMWIVTVWTTLYGIGLSVSNLQLRIFIANVTYIPTVLSTLASLALALEYTGNGRWLTRQRLSMLLILPVIFLILAFTSEQHHLWRFDYQLIRSDSVPVLIATKGSFYWLFVAYMLGMSLITLVILSTSFNYKTLYFRNTLLLSLGILLPVIVGLLYVIDLTPIRGLDWIPISFIGTGVLYIFAILRGKLFDVAPIARNTLIENIDDIMLALNTQGSIIDFNHAAQTALDLSPTIVGSSPQALPQPWAEIFQTHADISTSKEELTIADHTYDLTISPIHDNQAHLLGMLFLFHDISHHKDAENKLRQLSRAVEQSPVSIVITDTNGSIEYINPRFTQVTGYTLEEALGQNPRILKTDMTSPETHQQLWDTITAGREWHGEFVNRKKNGDIYFESASISPILDAQGNITHYVAVKEDITERKLAEERIRLLQVELREQAIRDPLTGLYNRRYLNEVLERELARAEREDYPVSFIMIDIDHFKDVNDKYGHSAGDAVLRTLAKQIMAQTRAGDIVCRYGGEEFLAILPNVTVEIAYQITERWRRLFMGSTMPLEYVGVKATISCGISSFPHHGSTSHELITAADKAMYLAKKSGRNRVVIWEM